MPNRMAAVKSNNVGPPNSNSGMMEIAVAPLHQRAFARFAMLAPEISGRIVGSAAAKTADAVAAGQTDKR